MTATRCSSLVHQTALSPSCRPSDEARRRLPARVSVATLNAQVWASPHPCVTRRWSRRGLPAIWGVETLPRDVSPGRARQPADARLAAALAELRRTALELEDVFASTIAVIAEPERASARNLVHYLALRRKDLRDLHRDLAERGLSSIGRAEAHVLATLDAVLARLGEPPVAVDGHLSFADSKARHERHATQALGTPGRPGGVRLMVTLPSEAATDAKVVDGLVEAGMDSARINCAHDGPDEWRAMAAHVRDAAARAGREVRVAFDLAGPKLRTGELEPGPRVREYRPDRGVDGAVQRPARGCGSAQHPLASTIRRRCPSSAIYYWTPTSTTRSCWSTGAGGAVACESTPQPTATPKRRATERRTSRRVWSCSASVGAGCRRRDRSATSRRPNRSSASAAGTV